MQQIYGKIYKLKMDSWYLLQIFFISVDGLTILSNKSPKSSTDSFISLQTLCLVYQITLLILVLKYVSISFLHSIIMATYFTLTSSSIPIQIHYSFIIKDTIL